MDKFKRPAGIPVTTENPTEVGSGTAIAAEHVDPVPTDIVRNRTRSRDSLLLIAQLQLGTERSTREVRVRNLSEGGLMLELDKIVEVGTVVRLDLRGIGETTGKVAWCTAGRIGVALDSLIDPKKARKPIGGMKNA